MEVKINDVVIPLVGGPVGLSFSGGADSSLLLYILLANKTEPLEIFTMASDFKGRISAKTTANVIDRCIQLTGNNKINHHVRYTDVQNDEKLFEYPLQMLNENKINILYTAVTANPLREIADNFIDPSENVNRDSRNPLVLRPTNYDKIYCPFNNIDKIKIAEMYRSLGLMETLFPLTRSCELVYPPEGYSSHCGNCWWCKERFWAFKRFI